MSDFQSETSYQISRYSTEEELYKRSVSFRDEKPGKTLADIKLVESYKPYNRMPEREWRCDCTII